MTGLAPCRRPAPQGLDVAAHRALPGLLIIEHPHQRWQPDPPALLRRRGYTPCVRTRLNTVCRRQAPA